MEVIVMLLVCALIAIPVIAIVALVRTGSAARRIEENWHKTLQQEGELAFLRNELIQLTARLGKFESTAAASRPADSPAAKPEPAIAKPAPAPAAPQQAPVAPQPASQPAAPVSPLPVPPAAPAVDKPRPVSAPEPAAAPPLRHAPSGDAPSEGPAQPQPVAIPRPAAPVPPPPPPRPQTPPPAPTFATYNQPAHETIVDRLKTSLPLEQFLGMNLFAKIGIVLLVLGFALLGRIALLSMGPVARVLLIYAAGSALLGGGIWLELREKYRLIGRTGIGGGWAMLFFTTYAMHHVPPMMILRSNTADCVLMLVVAVAMVLHTLRYRSQLVTGLAFLLAFSTVALSQDSVYALIAGVILALGIVVIALRMSWFELEAFGILSSYANHLYWLYRLYPDGMAGRPFPQFWPSAIILALYWIVFRVSYVARRIESTYQESVSTLAALANTMLLLVAMKFQSTHPEWAFYALLVLGALEFIFGQLPVTRRRHAAFALLTVVGTLLMFSAVPFRFSGNNIALFWMIGAEALLIAGIVQREPLFRYLGLTSGCVTGLLIVFEARGIVEFRLSSDSLLLKDGVLLLTSSALFYLNALFLRGRWREVFAKFEARLAASHAYLGCFTAFLGAWALFPADWTAIAWAALLLGTAFGASRLRNNHLLAQAWALTLAVAIRAAVVNCHFDATYPHHVALRLLTLPILAAVFYVSAWLLDKLPDLPISLQTISLWLGSPSLVTLAGLELPAPWIATAWAFLAIALCIAARRLQRPALNFQEHVLAAGFVAQLLIVNLFADRPLDRYLPLIVCAATLYAISRICTQAGASYRQPAAWLHTWAATALLAALAWHEAAQPWLTVIWILFALALAIVDRFHRFEELPWQAHGLAAIAVLRAVSLNFYLDDTWRGIHVRLISISILIAGLYAIARWVRLPEALQRAGARHLYTWMAAGLTAWLLWCELQPIYLAIGLAVLALGLFEIGHWREQNQIRLQAYALLAASFARIFFVNLTADALPGQWLSPRLYTVAPLACIYFYVWARLRSSSMKSGSGRSFIQNLIAFLGTGSIAAVLAYQIRPEWTIAAWAFVVLALMIATLALNEETFLNHAVLLTGGIVLRGLALNIFGAEGVVDNGRSGRMAVPALTAGVLFAALPLAFRIRSRFADRPPESFLLRWLFVHRPEQFLFFAPLSLVVFSVAVQMKPGMVTLGWGIVGVAAILLGLIVSERSYRLSGLFLLLLCVAKIVFRDAWRLDERDRYITFIALGAALTLVSALYSKYRDQLSRLL